MHDKTTNLKQARHLIECFSAIKIPKIPLALILFYLLYLVKSALGINISSKHSAPQVFKIPLMTLDCILPIAGNYCYKSKLDISLK
ncbi:hypothetical protein H1P_630027 [Hyella patelloides LEGE 07179]|uniref:Uncharacterized protein n=1 Tax=Hyella patelloides LEGE 07179 TaxID=945734 RepID=A0A563W1T6_9CYAN|nr:hypothetical protein [Hyella patelloides]VEP17630.1 hypothetical protein H1P_630027 [Hyella patelloides LEGE 07179]